MSARHPKNGVEKCPVCEKKQGGAILLRVVSRVYSHWECPHCGLRYVTDAASGRYIGVSFLNQVHDDSQ